MTEEEIIDPFRWVTLPAFATLSSVVAGHGEVPEPASVGVQPKHTLAKAFGLLRDFGPGESRVGKPRDPPLREGPEIGVVRRDQQELGQERIREVAGCGSALYAAALPVEPRALSGFGTFPEEPFFALLGSEPGAEGFHGGE